MNLPGLTCPAFLELAPLAASLASRMTISFPSIPFSVNSKAVSAPEIPDPIITYLLYVGGATDLLMLR